LLPSWTSTIHVRLSINRHLILKIIMGEKVFVCVNLENIVKNCLEVSFSRIHKLIFSKAKKIS